MIPCVAVWPLFANRDIPIREMDGGTRGIVTGWLGPAVCVWQLATWGVSPSDTAIEGMEGRPRGIELEVSNHVM